jgi:competence protein ComEA
MRRLFKSLCAAAFVAALMAPAASAQQSPAPQRRPPAASARKTFTGVVNINTAPAADLQQLPGIGAKTAARIIEYRQKNGPFKKIEELMNVRGIGEKNFLKLKAQITVAPAKADHAPQQ